MQPCVYLITYVSRFSARYGAGRSLNKPGSYVAGRGLRRDFPSLLSSATSPESNSYRTWSAHPAYRRTDRPNLDHETFAAAVHSLLPELFDFFPSARAFTALNVLEPRSALSFRH